ncbi:MAG: hypothetical protein C1941_07940 [Prosthecochloris sp.]|nr:hypothetical protein [Prosthecochloris sp.]
MPKKRLAIVTIAMITVITILVKLLYQEVNVMDLMTVIALLGVAIAFGIDFIIQRVTKKTEENDENGK